MPTPRQELLENIFRFMNEGVAFHEVILDDDGTVVDYRYIDVNPAFERLTGLSRETTVGRTVRELIPEIDGEWIRRFGRVAMTGISDRIERYEPTLDRWYRASAFSFQQGTFAVVFEDVTDQQRLIRSLQERDKELSVVIESAAAGIVRVDPRGRITLVNGAMKRLFGYSREELLSLPYPDLVHPDQKDAGTTRMLQLMRGEIDQVVVERHYRRKDGSDFWGLLSGRRLEDDEGNLLALIGHIIDISERKRAEEDALREKEKSEAIIAALGEGLSIQDTSYRVLYQNEIHKKLIGEHRGELCYQAYEQNDAVCEGCPLHATFTDGKIHTTTRSVTIDGTLHHVEITTSPLRDRDGTIVAGIELVRDITDRKREEEERLKLEKQLLHAQKLESLGVLAGGIAHDFNNILTAIIGNAELAMMRVPPESPVVEHIRRIEKAAGRAADLARQMLAYSGKGRFLVEPIDLNRLVEEMTQMLEVSISKKVVIRYHLHRPLPSVEADATQLRQVIMNLVINASEAIGEKSGVISLTTGVIDCDDSYLKEVWLDENLAEGLYVFLEVADTGCGMSRDTMARLFDPFFTTKFTGRGLGMAAVMGIVRGHRGAVKVYSEEGRGSTFKILLPACDRPAEIFNHTGDNGWRGSGRALLVDDEETVRGIGGEMLREMGFSVTTAADGREAVRIFREDPGFDLVILDLTMPHMDGEECYRELRRIDPGVRVVMSSGYNEQEITQRFAGKGLCGFIQKPYKLSQLKEVLKRMPAVT
ncbi:MAG: hypothetical protein Fur0034_19100 [Desulfuromonadia bacterium]